MTTREQLATLVEQLPEDKLQTALERLMSLMEPAPPPPETRYAEPEVTEFVIRDLPARPVRLPIRVRSHGPRERVVMSVGDVSERLRAEMQRLMENINWWNVNRYEVVSHPERRNRYIAISKGKVFLGVTYQEARSAALMEHAGDVPLVLFLPALQKA